ncbi:MAG: hypothetical protein NXI32_10120 [bacterium]|nr:hypothetical protein [bacterium]
MKRIARKLRLTKMLKSLRLARGNRHRSSHGRTQIVALASLSLLLGLMPCLQGLPRASAEDLRKAASWNWPDASSYEALLLSYLDQAQLEGNEREEVVRSWTEQAELARGPDLLQRLLSTAGLIEPRIGELVTRLQDPGQRPVQPQQLPWLTSDVPGWMQDTVRLACGRAFAQQRMYDEALEILSGLELVQVCDPSTLIFYRATCEHHLMKAKECLSNVDILLEREQELPVRYRQLAQLMKSDIQTLEADSLDEVSRLMRDVERRLDLGRAGKRVRDEEQEIVDKLDKLIEQIEQQMQQQQQQQQSQGEGSQQQSAQQAMDESRAAGGSGAGDVDKKDLDDKSSWGNLPAAQRQESLQRLTEELPSHYRDVIESYFRQLAKDRR